MTAPEPTPTLRACDDCGGPTTNLHPASGIIICDACASGNKMTDAERKELWNRLFVSAHKNIAQLRRELEEAREETKEWRRLFEELRVARDRTIKSLEAAHEKAEADLLAAQNKLILADAGERGAEARVRELEAWGSERARECAQLRHRLTALEGLVERAESIMDGVSQEPVPQCGNAEKWLRDYEAVKAGKGEDAK